MRPTPTPALITPTPWDTLRQFTDARIALGRAGVSLPTAAHLAFQLAHAQARDAVHLPLDAAGVAADLQALGLPTLLLHSQAVDRATYLQRPDLGRRLDVASLLTLSHWQATACNEGGAHHGSGNENGAHPCTDDHAHRAGDATYDLAVVVADGLSALAVHQNVAPLVSRLLERLQNDPGQTWRIAPLTVVEQGRVAIGDEVGEQLRANMVIVLIGERPGLSSPDSLGVYLTWAPTVGKTDAQRNCISNVRPAGLSVEVAAQTLHRLLTQAHVKQLSGVGLKDDVDDHLARHGVHPLPSRGGSATNEPVQRISGTEDI